MSKPGDPQKRMIGIIALVLLGTGIALAMSGAKGEMVQGMLSACWRVGPVMGVLWLAYDQVSRLPSWLPMALIVSCVAIALKPKYALILIPLALALIWLRPKK